MSNTFVAATDSPVPSITSVMMMNGENVRRLREARSMSQGDLAKAVGISQTAIQKIETGETKRSKFMFDLARVLGVPIEALSDTITESSLKVAAAHGYQAPAAVPPQPRAAFTPPPTIIGERNLPVYAAVEGGPGEIMYSEQAIDFVPRPWYLKAVKEGYAVLVVGESMVPAFRPGEMAIVNPGLSPLRDRDHIFIHDDGNGNFKASIKFLKSWTEEVWRLEQYNPPEGQGRIFELPRKFWSKALRVVGKYDGS